MPDPNYIPLPGHFIKAKFQLTNYPDGTLEGIEIADGPIFEIDTDSWNLNRSGNTRFVPTGKRGVRRIRGYRDWSATTSLVFNLAEKTHDVAAAGIVEGSIGMAYFFADDSDDILDAYGFPAIIDAVGDSHAFGAELRQNVQMSLENGDTLQLPRY